MTVTIRSWTLTLVGLGLTNCAPQIVVGEDRCGAARPAGSGVLELKNADPFWYPVDAGAHGATIDDHKLVVDRDVRTYFGLGVKLGCLDLTSYDGLSFRAVGSLGTSRVAEFQVQAQTYAN